MRKITKLRHFMCRPKYDYNLLSILVFKIKAVFPVR